MTLLQFELTCVYGANCPATNRNVREMVFLNRFDQCQFGITATCLFSIEFYIMRLRRNYADCAICYELGAIELGVFCIVLHFIS